MKKSLIITLSVLIAFSVFSIIDYTWLSNGKNHLHYNTKHEAAIDQTLHGTNSGYYVYKSNYVENYPSIAKLVIEGSNYKAITGDQEILNSYKGKQNVLLTDEKGLVTYEFNIVESGFYHIGMNYFPYEGRSSNIERRLLINGEVPFNSVDNIVFHRYWGSTDEVKKDIYGNDIRPSQVELPNWKETLIRDSVGYITEPFAFYFEAGLNEISFESVREPMVIGSVTISSVKALETYETILSTYETNNYTVADEEIKLIEAENPLYSTSPTLYPLNDRTSVLTSPSHASLIRLNTIGGNNWRVANDAITWSFEVEAAGLYAMSLRLKQKLATGMNVGRNIYIDGKIPFEELRNYEFVQSNDWRIQTLGTRDEAYLFYFEPGVHTISFEVSLAQYGILIDEIQQSIANLNKIYREILVYTGPEPDRFRDYQLSERIPNLVPRLKAEEIVLTNVRKALIDISGSKSEKTGILDTMLLQLRNFVKKPSEIHKKLQAYNSNISSLGTLITLLDSQPLLVDYFLLHSPEAALPRAKASAAESFLYNFKAFIASFITNYAAVGKTTTDSTETIEVWLSIGKDQANILRKLIDESFTADKGIQVDLKLVSSAVLLPATLSGQGPDVAMGVDHSVPVNYAMRNAAYDLSKYPDFNVVSQNFMPSAFTPFMYNGGSYALPEQQTFLMMFYRTDIFEELGYQVPNTWADVITLVPDLQKHNLEFYLPIPATVGNAANLAANPVFSSMFYQNGGNFYINNNTESGFTEGLGPQVFEFWTQFYTDYSFPIEANFINRFRSGQMPIGITYYNTYNTLSVFAPEIKGKWDFVSIPGTATIDELGQPYVRKDTVSSGTGIMILDQSTKKDAAWEYLKWWTKTETQVRFGREMEGILGAAARYPTANIHAMSQLPWTVSEYEKLNESWLWVKGIPEIPGSYMTGRHLDNALRLVINNDANPRETIYDFVQIINEEIQKKRNEFGLE